MARRVRGGVTRQVVPGPGAARRSTDGNSYRGLHFKASAQPTVPNQRGQGVLPPRGIPVTLSAAEQVQLPEVFMASSQVAWGLDIGATALKAIKLRRDGDRAVVEAFDVIEHDKFLSEPDVDRDGIIRTTLQKFIDRNNPKRDTLIIGAPGSKTFAKFVKLPPVQPNKIPEIVKFEAIQQIPLPLEQVNWDYQTFANADSPEVEVGIFAMKKDLVAQDLMNFQSLNMTVHGVQLAPLALYNAGAFDEWSGGKGTIIVDIGAEHTDVVIIDAGRIWVRTINLGGNHFTDALAKAFKQPFNRAEQLKRSAATSKYQKQIFQAMRPIFADLVAEINRSLGYYQQIHRDSRLERIVAVGNPFKLPNLQKYLQQELKMEVVRLESFQKASSDSKLAAGLQENILSLPVAYGLALQGLDQAAIDTNLLPVEVARQMLWARKRIWFAGAAAAVVVACGVCGARAYMDRAAFEGTASIRGENLRARKQFVDYQKEFNAINNTFNANKLQVDNMMKLAEHRAVWPAIINDIQNALPQAGNTVLTKDGYPADGRFIVLREISSEFKPRLSDPIPLYDNEEGRTARPAPGPAKAGMIKPPPPPGAERGFLIFLRGYTPIKESTKAYRLYDEFKDALREQAPKDSSKSYYFAPTNYVADRIIGAGAASGAEDIFVWNGTGEFAPFFLPEAQGLVAATQPTTAPGQGEVVRINLAPAAPGPMDPMLAGPKRDPQSATMTGYYTFKMKLRVYLK